MTRESAQETLNNFRELQVSVTDQFKWFLYSESGLVSDNVWYQKMDQLTSDLLTYRHALPQAESLIRMLPPEPVIISGD